MSRPEGGGQWGAFDDYDAIQHDAAAIAEFVPFRPGGSGSDERPTHESANWFDFERRYTPTPEHTFVVDDKVQALHDFGGVLDNSVPRGTDGKVTAVEHGLLEKRITVEFSNGYIVDAKETDIRFDSGWY